MAQSLGAYLAPAGITDRATVLIDAGGVVRYSSSVTPAGERDIEALAQECERLDNTYEGKVEALATGTGLATKSRLFVKSKCGASRAALLARDNLHIGQDLPVHNISDDASALAELKKLSGKEQVPCLVQGDKVMLESADIINSLRQQQLGW